MKMFKRYIAFVLLLCPVVVFAAANDNKILLDQIKTKEGSVEKLKASKAFQELEAYY